MTLIDNNVIITVILPPNYLGQLTREDNVPKNQTYVYTYDNAGNITSKKTYSLTAASSEPSGTPTTTTYGYSTGAWGDLLTSFNGSGITYDTIGNPLTYYGSRSFTWEGRRLVGATVSSKSLTFKYNDEGLRTSKTVSGVTTNYYYNGSQLIAEETNGSITLYMYNSTGIVGFRYRTSSYAKGVWDTYLYEKNLQGDIVAVYDGNGTKKISYTYDAWGNFTATYHNGASATNLYNPYTYRGYYYDKDLSLYYLSSRYYDSNTGRFINADGHISTGQGLLGYNMFAYCGNNPIVRVDYTGMGWIEKTKTFLSKVWNDIKSWPENTFGASSSTTATTTDENAVVPDPSPVTVKTGTKNTVIISQQGNSSKPVSAYVNKEATHPIKSSSAGINININNYTLNMNEGLDNISVFFSSTDGDTTTAFGIKLNVSEIKIGFEGSTTIQWDDSSQTTYTNVSVSGWAVLAAYVFITTGQPMASPSYAY